MKQNTVLEEMNEGQTTHEQIEKRAYEIYMQRNGHEVEDWLIAEEELKQKPLRKRTTLQ